MITTINGHAIVTEDIRRLNDEEMVALAKKNFLVPVPKKFVELLGLDTDKDLFLCWSTANYNQDPWYDIRDQDGKLFYTFGEPERFNDFYEQVAAYREKEQESFKVSSEIIKRSEEILHRISK